MPFKKGHKFSKGRPKGSKNKFTKVKETMVDAFERAGAGYKLEKHLRSDNPNTFFRALEQIVKVLPKDPLIVNEGDSHITYVWKGDRDKLHSTRLPEGSPQQQSEV